MPEIFLLLYKRVGRERGGGRIIILIFFYCLSFHEVTVQIYTILPEGLGPTHKLNYVQHIILFFLQIYHSFIVL